MYPFFEQGVSQEMLEFMQELRKVHHYKFIIRYYVKPSLFGTGPTNIDAL